MSLEDKINDKGSKGFVKKALKLGFYTVFAAGSAMLSYGLVGISGPLTGAAFSAGSAVLNSIGKNPDKKSKGLEGLVKDFAVGSLAGVVGVWGYDYAAQLFPNPGLGRALFGVTVANTTFTGTYMTADYIIKNDFNPSGIRNYFGKNFWPVLRDSTLWLGLPVALTINGYGIPATVGGLNLRGYPSILMGDMLYKVRTGLTQTKVSANASPALHPMPAHG